MERASRSPADKRHGPLRPVLLSVRRHRVTGRMQACKPGVSGEPIDVGSASDRTAGTADRRQVRSGLVSSNRPPKQRSSTQTDVRSGARHPSGARTLSRRSSVATCSNPAIARSQSAMPSGICAPLIAPFKPRIPARAIRYELPARARQGSGVDPLAQQRARLTGSFLWRLRSPVARSFGTRSSPCRRNGVQRIRSRSRRLQKGGRSEAAAVVRWSKAR
jgi:hypothetical protein